MLSPRNTMRSFLWKKNSRSAANSGVPRTRSANDKANLMVISGSKRDLRTPYVTDRHEPNEKKCQFDVREWVRLSLKRVKGATPRPPCGAEPETRRAAAPLFFAINRRHCPPPCRAQRQGFSFWVARQTAFAQSICSPGGCLSATAECKGNARLIS